jgi:single-strand DNA-binding protein
MSSYNNAVTIIGNVGRDAELKEIEGVGTVAKFPLAVYRSGKGDDKKTDWFRVECWHDLARGAFTYCKKGSKVIVFGSMKFDTYEKDGKKEYMTSLVAKEIGKDVSVEKGETDEDPF